MKTIANIGVLAWFALAAATSLAQERWPDERTAGKFLCHADFSLAGEGDLLVELGRLQQDLATTLEAKPASEPVHLFLFDKKTTYQGYMQRHFPKVPYRRALFIKARGPGMVFAYRGEEFGQDVRHESTHALLHTWLKSVPLWLDEGLAEYFEVPHDERAGHHPHLATVRTMVRLGELPRLEELESLGEIDSMGRDEYRDAWAWVHFCVHGPPEANEQLLRYLGDLEAGGEAGKLSDRLRRTLPDLNRRVGEHFR